MPAQAAQYLPWLEIAGFFVLLMLIRLTRKALRRRVDEIGYRLRRERGLLIWFWLNAPGVILHELSHALVVLLFYPFGFRITSITLFRVKTRQQYAYGSRSMKNAGKQSLQLGEVQYIHLQILRPGWPWWTLLFAPYLILTTTSELWPSSQDWRGARWLVGGIAVLAVVAIALLWYTHYLVFNDTLLQDVSSIATYIDFALLALVALDIIFLVIAEVIVQLVRR